MNKQAKGGSASTATVWKRLVLYAAGALVLSAIAPQASAQQKERSGKEIVDAVCASCHRTGANGAPKIGDKKAWAARSARGLTALSQTALTGIRAMPPHGGNPGVSDIEIRRAITYMVNQSGGHWTEPIDRKAPAGDRTGEQIVAVQCSKCHEAGVGGAPKIGDRAAWIPRAKQGFDVLVRSAINGHGGMPARGGLADLSDPEIRAAIQYMLNPVSPAANAPAAAPEKADPNHKVIDGIEIYFGAIPAESIRKQHPSKDQESTMHGGIPTGSSYYHLNISVLDAATKTPVKDAIVEAKVADPVMGDQVKRLEPMAFDNSLSYGNYFRLPGRNPYTIAVVIRPPGAARPIETTFNFRQ